MQAVILAAGEGQRLSPFTLNKPKVMIAIAGKPILQYVVEALAQNGIRDIVIVVGYCRVAPLFPREYGKCGAGPASRRSGKPHRREPSEDV